MTLTYNNNTALTRLIQFVFVAMLVFIGLTTTGCGLVDSNDPDPIERTLTLKPTLEVDNIVEDEVPREADDLGSPGDGFSIEVNDVDPFWQ